MCGRFSIWSDKNKSLEHEAARQNIFAKAIGGNELQVENMTPKVMCSYA